MRKGKHNPEGNRMQELLWEMIGLLVLLRIVWLWESYLEVLQSQWHGVLRNRGVEDVFIACVDGSQGFKAAIQSVSPQTALQRCVIHQNRNSISSVRIFYGARIGSCDCPAPTSAPDCPFSLLRYTLFAVLSSDILHQNAIQAAL